MCYVIDANSGGVTQIRDNCIYSLRQCNRVENESEMQQNNRNNDRFSLRYLVNMQPSSRYMWTLKTEVCCRSFLYA